MDKVNYSLLQQNQIRMNSEATREALLELHKWEQEIKSADKIKNKEIEKFDIDKNEIILIQPEASAQMSDELKEPVANDLKIVPTDELKKLANIEKEKGNAAVKKNNFKEALEFYTKAIEIYDSDPVFYSNRAHCHLKMDKFQDCVNDCTKAIELDNNQNSTVATKAIYRRMKAYESIEMFPKALLDCQSLIRLDKKQEEMYKKTYEDLKKKYEKKLRQASDYEKIEFISKPPNLRSKKPLKRIEVTEVEDIQPKIDTNKKETLTKPKVTTAVNYDTEIPDDVVDKIFDNATGEASSQSSMFSRSARSIFDSCASSPSTISATTTNKPISVVGDKKVQLEAEKIKMKNELNAKNLVKCENEKKDEGSNDEKIEDLVLPDIPKSGSQFHVVWRELSNTRKYLYLKKISSSSTILTKILDSILDSELLSEILFILKEYFIRNGDLVHNILVQLAKCSELSILSLLMSAQDRDALKELLNFMKARGKVGNDELEVVKHKFSID